LDGVEGCSESEAVAGMKEERIIQEEREEMFEQDTMELRFREDEERREKDCHEEMKKWRKEEECSRKQEEIREEEERGKEEQLRKENEKEEEEYYLWLYWINDVHDGITEQMWCLNDDWMEWEWETTEDQAKEEQEQEIMEQLMLSDEMGCVTEDWMVKEWEATIMEWEEFSMDVDWEATTKEREEQWKRRKRAAPPCSFLSPWVPPSARSCAPSSRIGTSSRSQWRPEPNSPNPNRSTSSGTPSTYNTPTNFATVGSFFGGGSAPSNSEDAIWLGKRLKDSTQDAVNKSGGAGAQLQGTEGGQIQ